MSHFDGFEINMWRGDTHRFEFVVKLYDSALDPSLHPELDPDSDPNVVQNITLWDKFWFTAKRRIRDLDTDAIIALDDGNTGGIARSDPVNGKCLVTILPAYTLDLPSSSRDITLFCDLQGIDGNGDVFTLMTGKIILHSDVTQRTT